MSLAEYTKRAEAAIAACWKFARDLGGSTLAGRLVRDAEIKTLIAWFTVAPGNPSRTARNLERFYRDVLKELEPCLSG